jgi:hypothetical protein
MKMKSKFQERLEHHIAARKAEKNLEPIPFAGQVDLDAQVCEKCGKALEIDQVHSCLPKVKSLAELANEFEDRYNEKMGRSGVRWAGD